MVSAIEIKTEKYKLNENFALCSRFDDLISSIVILRWEKWNEWSMEDLDSLG